MIKTKIKIYATVIFFLFGILLNSCNPSIHKIVRNPEKYDGKNVRINGKITSSIKLYDLKAFTIKDFSGNNIMVVTKNKIPIYNENIEIRGRVVANFKYHELPEMVIIKEKSSKRKSDVERSFEKERKRIEKIKKKNERKKKKK